MSLEFSKHWKRKRQYRPDISDKILLVVITRGHKSKDAYWSGIMNSTLQVLQSDRRLKVVYRVLGRRKYRIITAFWID